MQNFRIQGFWIKKISLILIFVILESCSQNYESISTANGRRTLIEEANGFLTNGNCFEAKSVLEKLYTSEYVDNEIKLIYSSCYSCAGGFSFPAIIGALIEGGSGDIWSSLVKANFSASSADLKAVNLLTAASIIRGTSSLSSSDSNYYSALNRPTDANMMMVLIQLNIISLTISTTSMGKALQSSGHKTQAITGTGSMNDLCQIAHAFYTINDSLTYSGSGSIFTNISASINKVCGTHCTGSFDPSVCTAVEQVDGAALAAAIDSVWSF